MGKCRLPGISGGENLTQVLDSQNAIITELEQKIEGKGAIDITEEVDENTSLIAQVLSELESKALPPSVLEGQYVWKKYNKNYTNVITLPSEYTRIEYIESNGTQYINTGFNSIYGWKAEFEWMFTVSPVAEQDVMGCYHNISGGYHREYLISKNNQWALGHSSNSGYGGSANVDTRYKISASTVTGNGYLIIDGTEIFKYVTSFGSHTAQNVYLFAMCNGSGGAEAHASGRVYSFKLYDSNDTLVRDCVPCINSSGVPGLYDLVENEFLTDAAGGSFIAGPTDFELEYTLDFVSVVMSDSIEDYPNGDTHSDGFVYELLYPIMSGDASIGIDFGEITITGSHSKLTFSHNLGVVPSHMYMIPKNSFTLDELWMNAYVLMDSITLVQDGGALHIYSNSRNTKTDTTVTFFPEQGLKAMTYVWFVLA